MFLDTSYKVGSAFQLGMFIIDVMRHDDAEAVPSIINMLNDEGCIGWRTFWPHKFTESEVVHALEDLLRQDMVLALRYDQIQKELIPVERNIQIQSCYDRLWFTLTEKGRQAWEEWTPPEEP